VTGSGHKNVRPTGCTGTKNGKLSQRKIKDSSQCVIYKLTIRPVNSIATRSRISAQIEMTKTERNSKWKECEYAMQPRGEVVDRRV